jgi:hypothetical protein
MADRRIWATFLPAALKTASSTGDALGSVNEKTALVPVMLQR